MTNEAKEIDKKPTDRRSTAPTIKLLERPPLVMRRPLCLLDGRAYAATWLDVAVTYPEKRETGDKDIIAKPEMVKHEQRLYIVRDDGVVFGDGASEPLTALPFRIDLPEIPPQQKCWTIHGVSRYRRGTRSNPVALFGQLVDVVDHFIDFGRSLTDQRTMAELLATYVFCTWLLEAFNVIGYLWPSGEHGCGKTQVLLLVAELSYLGMAIQAGGSYATLRDMADYGATLAFDDAENLASPRRTDPDKRTLLLAGNRRGSYVTVKEPVGKGRWRTRYVNAFCPRLFSAIELPDSVLASRTIILPLVRTMDRRKANAEPLDFKLWPHERQRIVDDLWAMATANLPGLVAGGYDDLVAREAQLSGRNLEPWRAILAVAHWLDDVDELGRLQRSLSGSRSMGWTHAKSSGLFQRLEVLSLTYQAERSGFEKDGVTRLIVQALCHCAIKANNAVSGGWDASTIRQDVLRFTVNEVKVAAQEIVTEDGLEDTETWLSNRKVGWVLSRLRFKRVPRPGGKGSRVWQTSPDELRGLATAYGVPWPNLTDRVDVKEQDDAAVKKSDPYAQIARWVTSADKVESSW